MLSFFWRKILVLALVLNALALIFYVSVRSYGVLWGKRPPTPELGVTLFLSDAEVAVLKDRAEKQADWLAAILLARYYGGYVGNPNEADRWVKLYMKNRPNEGVGVTNFPSVDNHGTPLK